MLAASVDPDDPWSHPEADRLDSLSVAAWLRDRGATPNVVRARDLAMLALSAESIERTSLLAELRKEAAAGGNGFYNYEVWECNRVAEGSATVALRMAEELGHRVRYATPVTRIRVAPQGCTVTTETGERFECDAVVCAAAGRARCGASRVEGVSDERLGSLDRQRHALAAKVVFTYEDSFWHDQGQNGDCYFETAVIGGTWLQREGIMSTLVPPERLGCLPHDLAGAARVASSPRRWSRPTGTRRRDTAGGLLPPLGHRPLDARATSPAGGRAT